MKMIFLKNITRLLVGKVPQLTKVSTRNLTQVNQCSKNVFSPIISQIATQNHWIYQQNDRVNLPLHKKINIELPNGLTWVPLEDPIEKNDMQLPSIEGQHESKEAVRMIIIRKKKMKKHKLKKLRKRMKFEWAKRRQRRELQKEKAFQAILIKQCKDGEAFSAEKYVEERIAQFKAATENLKNLELSQTSSK